MNNKKLIELETRIRKLENSMSNLHDIWLVLKVIFAIVFATGFSALIYSVRGNPQNFMSGVGVTLLWIFLFGLVMIIEFLKEDNNETL